MLCDMINCLSIWKSRTGNENVLHSNWGFEMTNKLDLVLPVTLKLESKN